MVLRVSRHAIVRGLWVIVVVIMALGIVQIGLALYTPHIGSNPQVALIGLDTEQSLPAWFSSMLMAAAAGLCFLASRYARARNPSARRGWFLLFLIFVYLSFDESVSIHERISWKLQSTFNLHGVFYFAWVPLVAPAIVLLIIVLRHFLVSLPSPLGFRVFVAGAVFVTGAMGFEMMGGVLADSGIGGAWYFATVIGEEGLEMAGLVLFVAAILEYLARTGPTATIAFEAA